MHGSPRRSLTSLCLAVLVLMVVGCKPLSPEQKVAAARAQYTVTLTSFMPKEPDPEEEEDMIAEAAEGVAVAAEAAAVAGEAAEETTEGEEMEEEEEPGPRPANILLDLLVRFNGEEALPGITVEIAQAGPSGQEKATYLEYIETGGIRTGEERQVPVTLAVDNFEDGDAFSIEWNAFVPPEEQGEYREFSEQAP